MPFNMHLQMTCRKLFLQENEENSMTLRSLGLCAALIAMPGCTAIPQQSAGTLAGISLHVQPETARAGQPVVLALVNEHAPEQLGYNLCTSQLEHHRDNDEWEPVPSDRVCTMELSILDPDKTARFKFKLPEQLAAGDYRAVTIVHVLQTDDRLEVITNPIRVE
jgi:hypothetical protein